MKFKETLINTIKILLGFVSVSLIIIYIIERGRFSNLSPDAIRFMHFWQINADQFVSDGGSLSDAIKSVYFALRSSNMYDVGRGRFIQYIFHGFDGLLKNQFPFPMINYLMIFILIINSALISWISTNNISRFSWRINLFILTCLILISSSFVISPVLLLVMYGKYLWLTFILIFFVIKHKSIKVLSLMAAAATDEIGLFAVMVLVFLYVIRLVLNDNLKNTDLHQSIFHRLKKTFIYSALASLVILFTYYGICSVFFGEGTKFLSFSNTVSNSLLKSFISGEKFFGIFLRAEMIIIGIPLGYKILTIILGIAVLSVIIMNIWKIEKESIGLKLEITNRIDKKISTRINNSQYFFYSFWVIMLIILIIILPAGGYSDGMGHYIYPAAAVLALLFFSSIHNILSNVQKIILTLTILGLHLIMLPEAIAETAKRLEHDLFPDNTVCAKDLTMINDAVLELKKNGRSPIFDSINNCQEIDFSGTWYYSRKQKYRDTEMSYFPIEGTVRVLLWPKIINQKCSNRVFDFKTASYTDSD